MKVHETTNNTNKTFSKDFTEDDLRKIVIHHRDVMDDLTNRIEELEEMVAENTSAQNTDVVMNRVRKTMINFMIFIVWTLYILNLSKGVTEMAIEKEHSYVYQVNQNYDSKFRKFERDIRNNKALIEISENENNEFKKNLLIYLKTTTDEKGRYEHQSLMGRFYELHVGPEHRNMWKLESITNGLKHYRLLDKMVSEFVIDTYDLEYAHFNDFSVEMIHDILLLIKDINFEYPFIARAITLNVPKPIYHHKFADAVPTLIDAVAHPMNNWNDKNISNALFNIFEILKYCKFDNNYLWIGRN